MTNDQNLFERFKVEKKCIECIILQSEYEEESVHFLA